MRSSQNSFGKPKTCARNRIGWRTRDNGLPKDQKKSERRSSKSHHPVWVRAMEVVPRRDRLISAISATQNQRASDGPAWMASYSGCMSKERSAVNCFLDNSRKVPTQRASLRNKQLRDNRQNSRTEAFDEAESKGTPVAVTLVSHPQKVTGAMPLDQLVIAFPAN